MLVSISLLFWLFFFYANIGWIVELSIVIIHHKPTAGRGFLSTPFCYLYGLGAVVMTSALQGLKTYPILVFLCCTAIGAGLQLLFGVLFDKIGVKRWWDYTGNFGSLGGYICLRYSLIWGFLGFLSVMWVNDFVLTLFLGLHRIVRWILLAILLSALFADLVGALMIRAWGVNLKNPVIWYNRSLNAFTLKLSRGLVFLIGEKDEERLKYREILWIFLASSFLGCLVETIFCRFSMGYWMNRSSLVIGPFSMVWGLGILLATVLLRRFQDKPVWQIFLLGTVVGAVFEYVCSVATEMAFGMIFWDYLEFQFNIGGRINLGFSFLWGVAAVIWIKLLYRPVSLFVNMIIKKSGRWLSLAALIFLFVDIAISCMALSRYTERDATVVQESTSDRVMDKLFPDSIMEWIYPKETVHAPEYS